MRPLRYIQEIWGFISPGIVAAFLVGLLVKRAPTAAGKAALLLGPVLYAVCRVPKWIMDATCDQIESADGTLVTQVPASFLQWLYTFNSWAFLHHMAVVFIVLAIVMVLITLACPCTRPIEYPTSRIDTTVHPQSYVLGSLIIAATVALYIILW